MLKGISWLNFLVFLVFVTGAYYLYVLVTYYKTEALEWLGRMRRIDKAAKTGKDEGQRVESPGEADPRATTNRIPVLGKEKLGGGDAQFQQTQRAIAVIREVIAQGTKNKLDRDNLLDHIKEVLNDYRQLRNTEYAETINKFLIRVSSTELGLELGEPELAELWK